MARHGLFGTGTRFPFPFPFRATGELPSPLGLKSAPLELNLHRITWLAERERERERERNICGRRAINSTSSERWIELDCSRDLRERERAKRTMVAYLRQSGLATNLGDAVVGRLMRISHA